MNAWMNNLFARVAATPQYLILFVSSSCWTRCGHCWYNEEWKKKHLAGPELTFAEIEKIVSSVKRIQFLSLTGGEAFLRDDIVDVARLFATRTRLVRYQIPTSGFNTGLIVDRTEKMLSANGPIPFRVDVSLDGVVATHDRIRNCKGSFANATRTIAELNRIKKRCPYFDVGVITTISNDNQREIAAIGEIVDQIHPQGEWIVNIVRGSPRDPSAATVDQKVYDFAHRLIESRVGRGGYVGHGGHFFAPWLSAKNAVRRKLISRILAGEVKGGYCAAGALGGVIYNDGSVYPCELLNTSYGNVRDFNGDLAALWRSGRARAARREQCRQPCVCTQECFHSINIAVQPAYWPSIVAERIRLGWRRTKARPA